MIRKICLFVIWGLIAAAPVRAAVLTVTPSTQAVSVGDTLTFDLQPTDLIVPSGKQIGVLVFSSDRDFTLWPKAGTELKPATDSPKPAEPVVP